jgi:cell division protein FtsW
MSHRSAIDLPARRPDYVLLAAVLALTAVGLLAVYSASFAIGMNDYHNPNYFIVKQAISAVIGLGLMFALMRIDYRYLRNLSPLIMLVSLLLLLVVLVPHVGVNSNGARRWIAIGPLPPLEPSEFAKLAMIIYIAAWLSAKGEQLQDVSLGLVPFVMMVGLIAGLILLEPDMGTAVVIALTTMTMFFVAGASLRHVLTLLLAGLLGGLLLILVEGYRSSRLLIFLNPEKDPAGAGFHIIQLLIALGSGGLHGLGLGASRQKFFYVPGAHTDGIFAIIGEEVGLIGALVVIALFALLVWRGFRAAFRAQDNFAALVAVGVTCWIGYEAVINIGGITRSMPMTGIPLPLISYGGSALMATLAAVGILLNVTTRLRAPGEAPAAPPPVVAREADRPARSSVVAHRAPRSRRPGARGRLKV